MRCHYTLTVFTALLFSLSAFAGRVPTAATPYTDSVYKGWYFTPTGVFGRGPLNNPRFRAFVRITHPARDLTVVESINSAGITVNTSRIWFSNGLIALATETNRWGDTYDSTWYRPDGPGKFLITRRTKGVNPYLPAKFLEYSFKNDLLTDIICFTDSLHAGPGREGVSHYVFERYDDANRRALVKTEIFFTDIDIPALSVIDGCHKVVNEYDEKGDLRSRTVYNENEKPMLDRNGVFKTTYKYDSDDNQDQIDYYDTKGQLAITVDNYSEKQLEYKHGLLTEEAYFFEGQRPALTSTALDAVSIIAHKYDQAGNEFETDYFDKDRDPINNSRKFQQVLNAYNSAGQLIQTSLIPLAPGSRLLQKIYTISRYSYDDKGRLISQERLSNTGARLPDDNLVNLIKYSYDAWGRIHSMSYWENDSTKMIGNLGYHETIRRYDANGQIVEHDYYGLNGQPATRQIGYSRELITYNEMGLLASRAWFAGDNAVSLNESVASVTNFHRILFHYDILYRLRSVEFTDEHDKPISAILHPDRRSSFTARTIDLQFNGGILATEELKDTADTHITLDCTAGQCLPLTAFENHSRTVKMVAMFPAHSYHGAWHPDTLFENMLGFISRDSILVFMTKDWSRQTELSCGDLYRVAPINKYYQFDGRVVDYYLDNDTMAASFNYARGKLEGPAYIFYPNGIVRERGAYRGDVRIGTWESYYDNGQRERTIQYVQGEPELIDCYTRQGEVLARDGDGRFEGYIATAASQNQPTHEVYAKGNIKSGVPDGEWNLYVKQMTGPANTEFFTLGRFQRGISYSMSGKTTYKDRFFSNLTGMHDYETIDHYRYDPMCTPGIRFGNYLYPELIDGFKKVLAPNRYASYSGWVFLNLRIDPTGHILDTEVTLFQPNEEFKKDIRNMASQLPFAPIVLRGDLGSAHPYEKMYIILVEGGEVVIPEQVLEYQRSLFR
jgi:antitoxin component YwqK of YwqJK toxin-antitoxin module